jgi:hypothetical protein
MASEPSSDRDVGKRMSRTERWVILVVIGVSWDARGVDES